MPGLDIVNTYRAVEIRVPGASTWSIEWSKNGIARGHVCEGFATEAEALYWVFQLARIEAVNQGRLGSPDGETTG